MKKWLVVFAVLAVTLILVLIPKEKRIVVRVEDGPDVTYSVLVEGTERVRVRKGEMAELKLEREERAVEVAVEGVVIDSTDVSRSAEIVFDLPPVQEPEVLYSYEGSYLTIDVRDSGPYPVIWKANGKSPPIRVPIGSEVAVEGKIQGVEVSKEDLSLAVLEGASMTYDGNVLRLDPILKGFFKPSSYEINGVRSRSLVLQAESLPKAIEIIPLYGSVPGSPLTVKLPEIPDVRVENGMLVLPEGSFTLNGREITGSVELPDGTSTLVWEYREGKLVFRRVWKLFVDRKPPSIDVKVERKDGGVVIEIRSDEWARITVENGPVVLRDEGTEVYFRIRKLVNDVITVRAVDKSGNKTFKKLRVGEVGE